MFCDCDVISNLLNVENGFEIIGKCGLIVIINYFILDSDGELKCEIESLVLVVKNG